MTNPTSIKKKMKEILKSYGVEDSYLDGEVEEWMKLFDSLLTSLEGKIEGMNTKTHICRFNDGEQNCECYLKARDDILSLLQEIKEKK